jgi:hypothetical protein
MKPKKLTIEDLTSGKYSPKGVKMNEVLPGEKDKASLTAEKVEQIYRRSSKAVYKYGDTPIASGAKVEQPLISPDGKNVAYVKDNNLFLEPLNIESKVKGQRSKVEGRRACCYLWRYGDCGYGRTIPASAPTAPTPTAQLEIIPTGYARLSPGILCPHGYCPSKRI